MRREAIQNKLFDGVAMSQAGRRTTEFLDRVEKLIPWGEIIAAVSHEDAPRKNGGAPGYPHKVLVRCMLLQQWYGLSDPQMEEQLRDRLSFRRFVGLGFDEAIPDETTVCLYRKGLVEVGAWDTLFAVVNRHLDGLGVLVKQGTLVDATILEAPKGRKKEDQRSTRDPEAGFTKKNGKTSHGYKLHVAVDHSGLITHKETTPANVHDSQKLAPLIAHETVAVHADSAYKSQAVDERLKQRGLQNGILEKRVRGQAELSEEQKAANRGKSKLRARVEHPFAWIKKPFGKLMVRYRGLKKNTQHQSLLCAAYNLKRAASMLCPV